MASKKKETTKPPPRKRKRAISKGKSSSQANSWKLPNTPMKMIDPLFRHRVQEAFHKVLGTLTVPGDNSFHAYDYALRMERILAINCNFEMDIYEDMTSLLIYAIKINETLQQTYDPSELVSLDEEHLFPDGSIGEYQRNREVRRFCFESLLKKLTSDVAPDGHPLLQCRRCGGQADFNPVQTRSADESVFISIFFVHKKYFLK